MVRAQYETLALLGGIAAPLPAHATGAARDEDVGALKTGFERHRVKRRQWCWLEATE